MDWSSDRRVRWAVVAGAALLLLVLAAAYLRGVSPRRSAPAARTGPRPALQVRMGETGSARLDPKAPLRCFVGGRFVGATSLAECARRNGVDPGRMDVGVDTSGQVAAAGAGEAELAALPEDGAETPTATAPEAAPSAAVRPGGACLRHAGGQWREAGVGLSLRACVRTLFEGRCVRPGEALYGRYGERTLRLVPGRVEGSTDDRNFSFVTGQDAEACQLDG